MHADEVLQLFTESDAPAGKQKKKEKKKRFASARKSA
jgi:hypothetical protein